MHIQVDIVIRMNHTVAVRYTHSRHMAVGDSTEDTAIRYGDSTGLRQFTTAIQLRLQYVNSTEAMSVRGYGNSFFTSTRLLSAMSIRMVHAHLYCHRLSITQLQNNYANGRIHNYIVY